MAATLLMAVALIGQPATAGVAEPAASDHVDVAYEQLAQHRPNAAIERIKANKDLEANDPAALINLGAAYAMLGQNAKAEECYRAAAASDARYELQLADGSWMDSRRLARVAIRNLDKRQALAAR